MASYGPPNLSQAQSSVKPPKVAIILADDGQEPSEISVPWKNFQQNGWEIDFMTENGGLAKADQRLLAKGLFGAVLGASKTAAQNYQEMTSMPAFQKPLAWSREGFSLTPYDAVLLPGGHDKPIRQYLESKSLHLLLREYWPLTRRVTGDNSSQGPAKVLGAICHGVLVLANTTYAPAPDSGNEGDLCVLHDVETTTLPHWMEGVAWVASQAWRLGDYYRTYGEEGRWCNKDVLGAVNNKEQYKRGPLSMAPFAHVDPKYHYISARFPGDADLFAQKIVEEVEKSRLDFKNRPQVAN